MEIYSGMFIIVHSFHTGHSLTIGHNIIDTQYSLLFFVNSAEYNQTFLSFAERQSWKEVNEVAREMGEPHCEQDKYIIIGQHLH